MLERKGKYILANAIFVKSEEEKEVDYEAMGLNTPKEYIKEPIRFRIDSVEAYNRGDLRSTTVRLSNGGSFNIDVPFDKFDKFILELENKKWYQIV